jgi:nicotinate phosphoribosyltransferase
LTTAFDEPALGGVYKLAAVREPGGSWRQKVKLSEQAIKISTPGIQQVRRFRADGEFVADALYDETLGIASTPMILDPLDMTRRKHLAPDLAWEDLLVPVFRGGRATGPLPSLAEARARAQEQLAGFHAGIKRFVNPHQYPVGLEERLFDLKTRLVLEARGEAA